MPLGALTSARAPLTGPMSGSPSPTLKARSSMPTLRRHPPYKNMTARIKLHLSCLWNRPKNWRFYAAGILR
ncbi:MAG: hypothetical protein ACO3VC_08650, partial [Ilumatobacteraceae bacterium]